MRLVSVGSISRRDDGTLALEGCVLDAEGGAIDLKEWSRLAQEWLDSTDPRDGFR